MSGNQKNGEKQIKLEEKRGKFKLIYDDARLCKGDVM